VVDKGGTPKGGRGPWAQVNNFSPPQPPPPPQKKTLYETPEH